MPPQSQPLASIIVPVHNAAQTLPECLEALRAADCPNRELIVVDDHSGDASVQAARALCDRLICMPQQRGPAAARNLGASQAKGDVLVFVDADVIVRQHTVDALIEALGPGVDAVVGVYDEGARFPNFSSRFKNLWLCCMFDNAPRCISWFWTGCAAIRKEVFDRLGGFDEGLLSCEDYDLGYQLSSQGGTILLDRSIRVRHRHIRSWVGLLTNDFQRSRNNVRVLLGRNRSTDGSFATVGNALGVAASYSALLCLGLAWWWPGAWMGWLLSSTAFLFCNRTFLNFVAARSAIHFTATAIPLLYLVFLAMGLGALTGAAAWAFQSDGLKAHIPNSRVAKDAK